VAAVSVIATSDEGTREALRVATELAGPESSKLLLFVRSGDRSGVPAMWKSREATVLTYNGQTEDLVQLVPRSAPVVLGGGGGLWWPTPEQQLARKFADLGYRVIFALSARSWRSRAIGASAFSFASSSGDT
jgi:hypothetical protein